MKYRRFVAIGDSQTEGLHDYHADGRLRGWADRFAERLAEGNSELLYANLAVRGRRSAAIRAEQLEPALALEPDLASVMSGVNDVIRPGVDLESVLTDIEAMYAALAATGCTVMSCTFPIPSVGLAKRLGPKLRILNAGIRAIAAAHRVVLVDLEPYAMAADLRLWSEDRVHLNPEGHARLAAAFAATLLGDGDGEWKQDLPPAASVGRARQIATETSWIVRFMLPKIGRMLRGRSSGDDCLAKRPALEPVRTP